MVQARALVTEFWPSDRHDSRTRFCSQMCPNPACAHSSRMQHGNVSALTEPELCANSGVGGAPTTGHHYS